MVLFKTFKPANGFQFDPMAQYHIKIYQNNIIYVDKVMH